MTFTEQLLAEHDAKNTGWFGAVKAGALGSFLLFASPLSLPLERPFSSQDVEYRQVDDTQRATVVGTDEDELALLTQLNRVYDYLANSTVNLDEEAHKLLYSNLWNMYD